MLRRYLTQVAAPRPNVAKLGCFCWSQHYGKIPVSGSGNVPCVPHHPHDTDDTPPGRLTDHLDLAVLAWRYPAHLIDEVLADTGKKEKRSRSLPARVMVRFAIAQGLHHGQGSDAVMRELAGSLRTTRSWAAEWKVPSTSAIAQARARLGPEPLAELFDRACVPLAGLTTPGARLGPWRLTALDGTGLDVADTKANAAHYGYAGNDRDRSAFPKLRLLTLTEVGTRAAIGARMGPWTTGERTLAQPLADLVDATMLVLADAGFYSWDLFGAYSQAGAALAWRVGASVELPLVKALADGSYTALVFALNTRRGTKDALIAAARAGQEIDPARARLVRAVDYTVPEADPDGELITVVTTVLDHRELSAEQIAWAYGQRWEHETALGEVKRCLIGRGEVSSSNSPSIVEAQVWGLLLAHYALRALMCGAADGLEEDPDRFSFTHTLRVVRPAARGGAAFSP